MELCVNKEKTVQSLPSTNFLSNASRIDHVINQIKTEDVSMSVLRMNFINLRIHINLPHVKTETA